jgi:hypothetical protein
MIARQNPGAKVEMNVDKHVDEKLLDELERRIVSKKQRQRLNTAATALFSLTEKILCI